MSAVAFPAPAIRVPARRRHLSAVPAAPAAPVIPPMPAAASPLTAPSPVNPSPVAPPPVAPSSVRLQPAQAGAAGAARPDSARANASRQRPAATPLRLTARGRGVLATLALLGALAGGAVLGMATASGVEMPAETDQVTVLPGETLWGIATDAAEEGQDVRNVMEAIVTLNSLSSATVHPGQELAVPAN